MFSKFSNNFIEVNDWVAMTLLTIQVKNKLRLVISGSVNENVILAILCFVNNGGFETNIKITINMGRE